MNPENLIPDLRSETKSNHVDQPSFQKKESLQEARNHNNHLRSPIKTQSSEIILKKFVSNPDLCGLKQDDNNEGSGAIFNSQILSEEDDKIYQATATK